MRKHAMEGFVCHVRSLNFIIKLWDTLKDFNSGVGEGREMT